MAWGGDNSSAALALGTNWATVQASGGGDLVISLNPGETASMVMSGAFVGATEDIQLVLQPRVGSTWATDLASPNYFIYVANGESPGNLPVLVTGPKEFRIRGRLLDQDGTPGGDDSHTLTVHWEKNGVNL